MDIRKVIEDHIPNMDSPEKVYELFSILGYKVLTTNYKGKAAWTLPDKDNNLIKDIYIISNYSKRFQIFLIELSNYSSNLMLSLPRLFEREIQYPLFIFTVDYQKYTLVFLEKIREGADIWQKSKLIKLNIDRTNPYYTDKLVISHMQNKEDADDPMLIYKNMREAFSIEKVSKL